MASANQSPEQIARDLIDALLRQAGWVIQPKNKINFSAGVGVAIREYQTDAGPADYVLFVEGKPIGVIEAKREDEGHRLTVVEEQSAEYADSKLKYIQDSQPLPFIYESTGAVTRFTDRRDPKPRARPVFAFHRPTTFQAWLKQDKSLRSRVLDLPELPTEGLRDCQIRAIANLETSFKASRPRALIQMATGSGKTFTAITFIYRLLKFAKAKRVLFLVDTKNLGEQAEQEFMAFTPNDDNRKFTELYAVQRLKSSYVATDSQVCISTIQRLYSILKGEELDEKAEEANPNELVQPKAPLPVVYNDRIPIEFFDFIVIDECHRSIYNLWKQVLDYFDGFLIGLTATPDKRTFGFFDENVVSEYSHEQAVIDGVNVGYVPYIIETEITKNGSQLVAKEYVERREKLTRKQRWEQLDEDVTYSGRQLDKNVVNPSQIRNIIRAFRDKLPEIFPNRQEVPKTLIFAKDDSHADDIIKLVREEFGEGNAFCKKVTYKAEEDPKSVLAQFRNDFYPRIAVTVDMIATGTDVKPLECLLFMRDVKSKNYYDQMKGRGTRTLGQDDLKKVTPSAASAKTHFVIVDAIGVTKSLKTDTRALERKHSVPIKDLMMGVMMGAADEDSFLSLASRLTRLERQMSQPEQGRVEQLTDGKTVGAIARALLDAYDPDVILAQAQADNGLSATEVPTEGQVESAQQTLIQAARTAFTGELIDYLDNVRKVHEQIIDVVNLDRVTFAGWDQQAQEQAQAVVQDFTQFIEANKDEITALRIFYNQPYQRRTITYQMVQDVLEILKTQKPNLAPLRVWQAYEQVEQVNGKSPIAELVALVSLIRRVVGIDSTLTNYETTVNRNFQDWIFRKQAGALKFNEEQVDWLRMIKDYIATSFHLETDDLEYEPFGMGGTVRMYELFGEEMDTIIQELNEALAA
ncbi:MAG: type I restriction-modification enzyme R subunit C-terminal domain-containing protein [Leptolyngbyaceae cyanobacterium bins.302]|nr:type I restriction-modification enzyme R subunit C-terminal domain-containing protein [Leptolyngbyaceae cyanobacterium bins.302]